jgi:hypothetical protein
LRPEGGHGGGERAAALRVHGKPLVIKIQAIGGEAMSVELVLRGIYDTVGQEFFIID